VRYGRATYAAPRAGDRLKPLSGDVGRDAGQVRSSLGSQAGELRPGFFRRAAEPFHQDSSRALHDRADGCLRAQLVQLAAQPAAEPGQPPPLLGFAAARYRHPSPSCFATVMAVMVRRRE